MSNDPTSDEPAAKVRGHLRDGARSVSADYERALAGIEAIVTMLPALVQRTCERRATLDHLAAQARAEKLSLPAPQRVVARGPLVQRLREAQHALTRLEGA
ncbi:MAG: hypothetical protein MUP14_02400 [Dehalococcoidia bacterium]|nr:hypothetical protein [Dehalococcoidia bacterium]